MRRFGSFFLGLLALVLLVLPVHADNRADRVELQAFVQSDSSCQITITATVHLEQGHSQLYFPVPLHAEDVRLGGSRASITETDHAQLIALSDYIGPALGEIPLVISYTLKGTVVRDAAGQPQLQLPLLSGFPYPIDAFSFTVTLPGQFSAKPTFSSGYLKANIEKDLSYDVDLSTIRGTTLAQLRDQETLTMSLSVPEGMFSIPQDRSISLTFCYYAILILAILALGYWLVTMRCAPLIRKVSTTAPFGFTAGELGCLLHHSGADLGMMVFSWGQLGYLLIQIDRSGRTLLHKRMDMGNERSAFERRCFQLLFAKRSTVDTGSLAYANTRQRVAALRPELSDFLRRRSGNARIFRGLCSLMGLFFGVCIGASLSSGAFLQWLFAITLGLLGLYSSWKLQQLPCCLHLPDKQCVRRCVIHMALWLLFGLIGGQVFLAILAFLVQLLAGLMAAFGGRRTKEGRNAAAQILGLRRYLKKLPAQELRQIQQTNPEFFHTMAPFALALGVDKVFARHFGQLQLPGCSYLATGTNGNMTASEWSKRMRATAESMDARYRQLSSERFLRTIQSLRKK